MSVFTNAASASPEQAKAYTAAVLGLVGDADPFAILEHTKTSLDQALAGLTREQLGRPEAAGKWSIAAVVQHLADSEIVWAWRLRMVLAQDRPEIAGYDQDAWADRLAYNKAEVEHALVQFDVLREANLRLLRRCSQADLDRIGRHTERGDESVGHMVRLYAGHDLLHRRQIDRIRRAVS
jgi:uncharacterized damage-inducible protein DinB